jgi:hypothetical protein
MSVEQFPVIVNVRDRLESLRLLVAWLEAAGQRDLYLLDNASTYPPLLEWLDQSRHTVVRSERNLGHRGPWLSGLVPRLGHDRCFVVTDPDVVPTEECPLDALHYFRALFDEVPIVDKIGFGLRIDDLPDYCDHKAEILAWERRFWEREVVPGVYGAAIDTTFALYRPGRGHWYLNSLRTGPPYVARHLSWYVDSANLTDEQRYYRDHADPLTSNWDLERVPARKRRVLLGLTESL